MYYVNGKLSSNLVVGKFQCQPCKVDYKIPRTKHTDQCIPHILCMHVLDMHKLLADDSFTPVL